MERGIRLIGNGQAPVHRYWKQLLRMVQEGTLDPTHMLSHRVRLDNMKAAYEQFAARAKGVQKIYVETRFSDARALGPELTAFAEEEE